MAPGPHETSGSLSSNDSTAKLISTSNSCSSIAVNTYIGQTHSTIPEAETSWNASSISSITRPKLITKSNSCIKYSLSPPCNRLCMGQDISINENVNYSVSSRHLFGDGDHTINQIPEQDTLLFQNDLMSSRMLYGDGDEVFSSNSVFDYDHNIDLETFDREQQQSVPHSTNTQYCSVEEHIYSKLQITNVTDKSKQRQFPSLCLWISFSIGFVAIFFVAIFSVQYHKSIKYVYKYENCTLCTDVAEYDKQFISYLRRRGDLKYCCFKSSRDPVYRLNKAVEKAFAPSIKAKQLKLNRSIEINGTDAAMVLTLEIGSVSTHFKDNPRDIPVRKLIPLSCGIKIENDQLVIQTPGRYFILSQFYHNMKYEKYLLKKTENIVGLDIHRANVNLPNDGRDQLLVHFYTARVYSPLTDYHVSYMAGIFQLEKNDKLYVGASQNHSTGYSDTSRNRLSLIFLGNQTERGIGYITKRNCGFPGIST